tara:strand:+ start:1337 stop:2002 length:666 start_codon:yes stop_codon:yes gene_type:complete
MAIHKVDGVDGVNNFPKKFVTLYASEAITKGDLVALDLSDSTNGVGASIRPADVATDATAGGGQPIALGFATEGVAAGAYCKVQTAGKFTDANVHSDTVAGDSLYASIFAGRAYPTAEAYAGINVETKDPGAAGDSDIAIAGILTTDELVEVFHHDDDANTGAGLTASITTDGNIQSSTATNAAGDYIIVTWRRDLNKIAYALEADTANKADVMILDQGLF